jgi:putative ABC transport system permease protein
MRLVRLPFSILALFFQSVVLALGQIWANKTRSFLTSVGIVIGVASVSAVIACLTGLKAEVLSAFESLGTNKMFIYAHSPPERTAHSSADELQISDFEGLLGYCPSLKAFTRVAQQSMTATHGSKSEKNVPVAGVEPSWHQVENRTVTMGRPILLIDNEHARPVCLINERLRERLALPTDPTGESIMLGERPYRIIGVLETRTESSMFDMGAGSEVCIPFNTASHTRSQQGFFVIAMFRAPELSDEAKAETAFFLRHKRKLRVGAPDDFGIDLVQTFLDKLKTVAAAITLIATCVVGISLLVGTSCWVPFQNGPGKSDCEKQSERGPRPSSCSSWWKR